MDFSPPRPTLTFVFSSDKFVAHIVPDLVLKIQRRPLSVSRGKKNVPDPVYSCSSLPSCKITSWNTDANDNARHSHAASIRAFETTNSPRARILWATLHATELGLTGTHGDFSRLKFLFKVSNHSNNSYLSIELF